MFDKLEDLLIRFDEVLNELGEPGVTDNQERFQKLMKEQSDLQPIVDAYKEYKENKETIQDSLSMLEGEKDEEMREMLKEGKDKLTLFQTTEDMDDSRNFGFCFLPDGKVRARLTTETVGDPDELPADAALLVRTIRDSYSYLYR